MGIEGKILCIGDLILDRYIHGDIERISPEAPIPILKIGKKDYNVLGGCGNVVRNICSAKSKCHLVSIVGKDTEGTQIKNLLKEVKYLTYSLIIDKGRCTTKKTRYVSDNQQILRVDQEQTNPINGMIEKKILTKLDTLIDRFDVIVLSDYNKGLLTNSLIRKVIRRAKRKKKVIIVDPKKVNFSVYSGATYIKPNFKELKQSMNLSDDSSICDKDKLVIELSKKIIKKFKFKAVITTRSSNGISVVKQQGDFFHLPSEAKEVFDVSGAGDTVLGYFASSISRGISLEISTQISNTAAGIAVGKFGTSVVDYKEINSHKNIKLSSLDSLIKTIKLHDKNKVIGFTNGCFDLLHAGHISYLKKAKELCDILILALNSDLSIKKLKGKNRPIVNEEDRIEILSCLPFLDQIIIFNELTPLNIIKKIKPNIIFKGKDYLKKQVVGFEESKSWGGKVKLIDFVANKSTTKIIERIKKNVT